MEEDNMYKDKHNTWQRMMKTKEIYQYTVKVVKTNIPLGPIIPLLEIYPKNYQKQKRCTWFKDFQAPLFVITKNCKQRKYPTRRLNKLLYSNGIGYYNTTNTDKYEDYEAIREALYKIMQRRKKSKIIR